MHSEYRYSAFLYPAWIVILFFVGLIPYGLIRQFWDSDSVSYIVISVVICLAYLLLVVFICRIVMTKIVISEPGISISRPFARNTISWGEIVEFGKYRSTSAYHTTWVFYVRTRGSEQKKIRLGTAGLGNVQEMVRGVFHHAHNARFVTLVNSSMIPFTKNIQAIEWRLDNEVTA